MKEKKIQKIIDKVKNDYNLIAKHFALTRNEIWPEMIEWQKDLNNKDKVLDVGCGSGRLLKILSDRDIDYVGVDISTELIKIAKNNYHHYNFGSVKFQEANILQLPFNDNVFDKIFCIATLQHVPGKEKRWQAVKEIYRILKPGGKLYLSNWYLYNFQANKKYNIKRQIFINRLHGFDKGDVFIPWKSNNKIIQTKRYYHAFTKLELRKILSDVGFNILQNNILSLTKNQFQYDKKRAENLVTIAQKPKI